MEETIATGDVLVSTLVRGTVKALAYEVLAAGGETVLLRPIGWERYTATVKEVIQWGEYDVTLGRRLVDKTRRVTRSFGRPARGLYCGPEEEKLIGWGGKFKMPGVSWPERNEMAFVYAGGGYPISILADEPPLETKRAS